MIKQKTLISYHNDNDRIKLSSDGTQFIIEIIAGMAECFLTVGFSEPNYAYRKGEETDINEEELLKDMIESFNQMEVVEFEDMVPIMYDKLKEINLIYNKHLLPNYFE